MQIHQPVTPVQEHIISKGIRGSDQLDGFPVDQFPGHGNRYFSGIQGTDQEGDFVVLKHFQQFSSAGFLDGKFRIGKPGPELVDDGRQHEPGPFCRDAQADLGASSVFQIGQPVFQFRPFLEDVPGNFHVDAAGVRKSQGLPGTVEQLYTHFFFNLAQGIAQGGLGNIELPGSLGHVPAIGHCDHILQFAKIHGRPSNHWLLTSYFIIK